LRFAISNSRRHGGATGQPGAPLYFLANFQSLEKPAAENSSHWKNAMN
jgi:hypothetical protein